MFIVLSIAFAFCECVMVEWNQYTVCLMVHTREWITFTNHTWLNHLRIETSSWGNLWLNWSNAHIRSFLVQIFSTLFLSNIHSWNKRYFDCAFLFRVCVFVCVFFFVYTFTFVIACKDNVTLALHINIWLMQFMPKTKFISKNETRKITWPTK